MKSLDELLGPKAEALESPWPEELPGHLSASQITMLARCPEQFRRRYILGEKARPYAAMVLGAADHYAMELNFIEKIRTGADLSLDDVGFAYAEGFEREVDQHGGASEIEWDGAPTKEFDKGLELVKLYRRVIAPKVQPIAVESEFRVSVPQVPVPVLGYIDVETETHSIERKTTKQAAKAAKPEWTVQGILYQAVVQQPIEYHLSVRTKDPKVYTPADPEYAGLRIPVSERAVSAMERTVQVAAAHLLALYGQFGPNEVWPGTRAYGWACGFCGWGPKGNQTCAWWGF